MLLIEIEDKPLLSEEVIENETHNALKQHVTIQNDMA